MTNAASVPHPEGLSEETKKMLMEYFNAFTNLYSITPLHRALRIIQQQNPELGLTETQFLAFVDSISDEEQEKNNFWIAGQEDLYEDVQTVTPPLRREIIAEHLYALGDMDDYEKLKMQHQGMPYYVPEKEQLLRYADQFYYEKPAAYLALSAYLKLELKLKYVDDILDNLMLSATMAETDLAYVLWDVDRMAGKKCFRTRVQICQFLGIYRDLYQNMRMPKYLGFTPAEMRERTGGQMDFEERQMDKMLERMKEAIDEEKNATPVVKKPGRNDPCPCGSGKKYKKCCGR